MSGFSYYIHYLGSCLLGGLFHFLEWFFRRNEEKDSHIEFLYILNEIDFNVKFTFETEADNTLPFLDTQSIQFQRQLIAKQVTKVQTVEKF